MSHERRSLKEPAVAIVAILALALMETVALVNGIDGALFGLVVSTIGGITGWTIRGDYDRPKRRKGDT